MFKNCNYNKKITLVPAVITITRKEWRKMPNMNYVILQQLPDQLRVGCYLPQHEFIKTKVVKPTEEEEKIITSEL